ncbi:hypothetical protein FOE78_17510 [Microlunatus elymi]|uniref:Uncharacterized protein n=1 Tax=Microlunatus elymi TaxID=2596828 RepID=A0A516Q2P1_9ACTN|nr:hypothetical protein [Microlunatus elymi]QDP97471.1 hypothetical protein FOE78_17510 [Microlunatus elymi]
MDNSDTIVEEVRDALAGHVPGGMVGAFVIAAELYDADGEPQLFTAHSTAGTSWTHLGMIEVLRLDTESMFRPETEDC